MAGELGADGTLWRRPGDIKTSERTRAVRSVRRDILRYKKVRKKRKRDVLRAARRSEEKEIRSEGKEIRSEEKKSEEKKSEEKK